MAKVSVTVKAHTADYYERAILVMDEQQVRSQDARIKDTADGIAIDPSAFPEAVRFTIHVKELG